MSNARVMVAGAVGHRAVVANDPARAVLKVAHSALSLGVGRWRRSVPNRSWCIPHLQSIGPHSHAEAVGRVGGCDRWRATAEVAAE